MTVLRGACGSCRPCAPAQLPQGRDHLVQCSLEQPPLRLAAGALGRAPAAQVSAVREPWRHGSRSPQHLVGESPSAAMAGGVARSRARRRRRSTSAALRPICRAYDNQGGPCPRSVPSMIGAPTVPYRIPPLLRRRFLRGRSRETTTRLPSRGPADRTPRSRSGPAALGGPILISMPSERSAPALRPASCAWRPRGLHPRPASACTGRRCPAPPAGRVPALRPTGGAVVRHRRAPRGR